MSAPHFRRNDDVAFRQVGDETLLVPIRTNPSQEMNVFALNDVGAFLWESLGEPRTEGELSARLTEAFEVDDAQASSDVSAFLAKLSVKQLVDRIEA